MSRLTFLNVGGSELEHRGGLHAEAVGLNQEVWSAVAALPNDYRARRWDDLVLNARDLLPDFGAALVLAATAVETRHGDALRSPVRNPRVVEVANDTRPAWMRRG
jgi:hypothetical protein